MRRAHRYVEQARLFVRDFTQGLSVEELRRLFDTEAARAYSVLSRDRKEEEEPKERGQRLLYRARVIFLGLSYKLTPPRRILFAASLAFLFFGLLGPQVRLSTDRGELSIDFSAFWFVASISALLFLFTIELVDRVRVRDEIEVARALQNDLLPAESPDVEGYRFAHSYRTANEVGGDYYDFIPLPDGRMALVVGDASGHGIAAGLLMAIANATLKSALDLDPEPSRVAAFLNRTLCRTGDRRSFMTLFYGLLTPSTGHLDYVCAGHPFPLLRRVDGSIVELGRGNLPLGLREELTFATASVTLGPGDLLLMFSDGLPEAVRPGDGEAFGFARLQQLMATPAAPRVLQERILRAFSDHVAGGPLHDDLTLVVVERQVPAVAVREPLPPAIEAEAEAPSATRA